MGGIALYLGLCGSLLVGELPFYHDLYLYILASGCMVAIGVADDKHDLSVRAHIIVQTLAASIMIFACDQYIADLGNLFGFGNITLGWLAVPFTYVAVLGAINAYNMVDGIDGLIGGVTLTTMLGLASLFYLNGQNGTALFCLTLTLTLTLTFAFALIPYLAYNLRKHCPHNKKCLWVMLAQCLLA